MSLHFAVNGCRRTYRLRAEAQRSLTANVFTYNWELDKLAPDQVPLTVPAAFEPEGLLPAEATTITVKVVLNPSAAVEIEEFRKSMSLHEVELPDPDEVPLPQEKVVIYLDSDLESDAESEPPPELSVAEKDEFVGRLTQSVSATVHWRGARLAWHGHAVGGELSASQVWVEDDSKCHRTLDWREWL